MKTLLVPVLLLCCTSALAGPARPLTSGNFSVQAPCGPAWDPAALQGQWFMDPANGSTNVNAWEYCDDTNSLTIAGVATNISYSTPGDPLSNITAFDIIATVNNNLPVEYDYSMDATNSHGEILPQPDNPGTQTMSDTRITAEFAIAETNMFPNGTPPYWSDPVSGGSYFIEALNEDLHAWYCWSPDGDQLPAGQFQVPAWDLVPATIPPGGSAQVTMKFQVTGSGLPTSDYRHSVIRASAANGGDVLYNRHASLKISHWLDTLLIDNGYNYASTPPPPWWEEEPVEYVYASDASVFYNPEEPEESHKMHHAQLPDPDGWDVRACNYIEDGKQKVLADDFRCTASGPITNITFWGSWLSDEFLSEDPFQGITNIHLSIHADIPDPDGDGSEYSKPELPALKEWDLDPRSLPADWNVVITPEDPSMQGWYDPNTGQVEFENHMQYFRYDITIPEEGAFVQTSNTIYWLDVSVKTSFGQWGWKTTTNHWNDDAVFADMPVTNLSQWIELYEPPEFEQSLDLAFLIDGPKAEPAEEYDWGDAPDTPYPTLAANSGAHHLIRSAIYLGTAIDSETNGQPNATATGDDANGATPDDEDGVTFKTPFFPGAIAQIEVTAAGSGLLNGWIDFNADGDWTDSGEQIFSDRALSPGLNSLNIPVPAHAVPATNTFMRLRYSTVSGLQPTGYASDGEVEDYLIETEEQTEIDWGDLPEPGYPVTAANNGAHHAMTSALLLGAAADGETNGQPSINADGDDLDGNNDEDGVILKTVIMPGGYASIDVIVSQAGVLDAWIDFNVDNSFAQPGDRIFSGQALTQGTNSLLFPVPVTAAASAPAHGRFRLTGGASAYPGGSASPVGLATGGEVEDYHWLISGIDSGSDRGDTPDPPYPTLNASGGAVHTIGTGVLLGAAIDAETNGLPDPDALGDDTLNLDDEDGVSFVSSVVAGASATVNLTAGVSGGYLDAWIDFNADGDWLDSGEQIFASQALSPGKNSLSFPVPGLPARAVGPSFARFRISSTGGLTPTGAAPDGEVEDYAVNLYQPAPTNLVITNFTINASSAVATIEWNAQSNISYQVLGSTNSLSSNQWFNVGGPVIGPPHRQTNSAAPTQQFYRVTAPWAD